MESFVLRVGGNEYRIAMPTAQVTAAEKQLGGVSLIEAMDMADRVAVQQALLWAGMQKYNHGTSLDKVGSIMDAMRGGFDIDGVPYLDFSLEVRAKLCTKILMVAGFFTETDAQEIDSKIAGQA